MNLLRTGPPLDEISTGIEKIVPSRAFLPFAPGGQKPFREKVPGLPKAFRWEGLDTLFFFVSFVVYIF
jgi:hypothetical protein